MIDRTTGSLTGHLLRTSALSFIALLLQALYLLIDLFWVARLGTEAVAAVGVSSNLMFFVLGATQVLGLGTTTLVAHAVGLRDPGRVSLVASQALALSAVVGVCVGVGALVFRTPFADALASESAVAGIAARYLGWFAPAMALQAPLAALIGLLRGLGLFRPVLLVQVLTVLLNLVLAPTFMFGWAGVPRLGVVGAAVATTVAIAVALVAAGRLLRAASDGHSLLRFTPRAFRPRPDIWRRLLHLGVPASAEFALLTAYSTFGFAISRGFGPAAQAGFGIGHRLLQAGVLPAVALGVAVGPIVGQNLGAGRPARIRETWRQAAMLVVTSSAVIAAAGAALARPLAAAFSADASVVAAAADYLAIAIWSVVPLGLVLVSASVFQGLGRPWPAFVTSGARVVVIAGATAAVSHASGFRLAWVWYISVGVVALQAVANAWLLARTLTTAPLLEPVVGGLDDSQVPD